MSKIEEILKNNWGYTAFRPLQADIINSVLSGTDTLALLPTGGGKSLCFQVPALAISENTEEGGVCIVISPLIALMRDQVANLNARHISAAAIHSGMRYTDIDRILDNAVYGGLRFLYLSPERLLTELVRERIKRMKVTLVAIDEAHCISQWGYDFRPPYLKIAELRDFLPEKTPFLALTATATPEVVEDICKKLGFKKGFKVFEQDFARKNLAYVVRETDDKSAQLFNILSKVQGTSVVYVRNRKRTREVAQFLTDNGIAADFYHAGLDAETRNAKQDAWKNNETRVIVATNAFGMGIDKPDVRSVVHLDLPESLEAYFQEAGRAGRDGAKAFAVLLYHKSDGENLQLQFEANFPPIKDIRRTYDALGSYFQLATGSGGGESFDFDIVHFAERFKLEVLKTMSCLQILAQDGWLMLSEGIFVASSLKFLVEREALYDFQLRNRDYERLIRGILRGLGSVMTQYVSFNELQLARFLKMPVSELERMLHLLHKEGIIDFVPRKEKPQLIFLRERVESQHLTIDMNLYMFRKKRAAYQLKKAIEYAEIDICRSQQLLAYFGQLNAKTCGVCDVCLKQKSLAPPTADEFERFRTKIYALLKREPLSLKEIVESFGSNQRTQVIQTVSFLLDEGFLMRQGEKLVLG